MGTLGGRSIGRVAVLTVALGALVGTGAGASLALYTASLAVGGNSFTTAAVFLSVASVTEWSDSADPTLSPSAVATVNNDPYLVLIYEHNGKADPSTVAVGTGSGTPFSSCAFVTSANLEKNVNAIAVQCTGNGSSNTAQVTLGNKPDLVTVQILHLSTGAFVALTGVANGTGTSATASLSSATLGYGEVALVATEATGSITPPSGMTLLGSQQAGGGGGGYTVGAYFAAQAVTSAAFPFTGGSKKWGTIALELGP